MKTKLFLSLILMLGVFYSCTPITYLSVTTPRQEQILEIKNSKNELFIKANQWMVNTFKSAKSIIQFQDKEDGKIMGKYILHEGVASYNSVGLYGTSVRHEEIPDIYCLITISIKDNATKIEITPQGDWLYKEQDPGSMWLSLHTYSSEDAKKDIEKLIIDYKAFMNKDYKW